jgi:hypothetical protein
MNRSRNEKLVEKRMYIMVDRIGMMRLRIKREKKEKEAILRGIREKFDKYADIVTDKIVNDNCVFLLGDDRSIKELSKNFVLEPFTDYVGKGSFYFLKKDDRFKSWVDMLGDHDKEFEDVVVDNLIHMYVSYDNITDRFGIDPCCARGKSIDDVRSMIKELFTIKDSWIESCDNDIKLDAMRKIMVKGIIDSTNPRKF